MLFLSLLFPATLTRYRNNNEESHGVRQVSNEFAASRFIAGGNSEHAVQVSFMQLPTLVPRCFSETKEKQSCEP
jgi:hypothetical protein